ncbi:acyl-CoA/acyl-ACP dehydrogenase [bacterium]|nr:acyl-CoA/acyl-ACP dehydrogenase [bacterium]
MRLIPTPEQQELCDAVARFCAEQITPERLLAWQREPRGIDGRAWDAIAELGWFGLALPEARGGSGLGLIELALLLRECGRGLIPRSVINAIRAGWALARLAPEAPELEAIAAGRAIVALALDEQHARDPRHFLTAIEGEAPARVRGEKWGVANGLSADWHLVAGRGRDGVQLALVRGEHGERRPLRTFDGEEQAVVTYADVPAERRVGGHGAAALAALRREATALALAEMVGGMQAALDATVAYVKEREQFGQKIAVFQAVQHQVADMATAYTAARHLTWQAITRMAAGSEQGGELEHAVAFTAPAFKRLAWTAHHLHGGAGFVVEHPLHYHSERAQALAIRYAPEAPALAAVAVALLD